MTSKPIIDLVGCWDKLTPCQQQALIHRARYFVAYNIMQANGMFDEDIQKYLH